MNIKTLPGFIVMLFGFVVIMCGLMNLLTMVVARNPWLAVASLVSVAYFIVRVLYFIAEQDRNWRQECDRAFERGQVSGRKGI